LADDEDCRSGSEEESALVPRPPVEEDLVALCRRLNRLGARYLVIGGYAIIHAGYPRFTADLDILMDTAPENEAKIYMALRSLKDRAVDQLEPGDISKYALVRVADEFVVDLMKSACGIDYEEASKEVILRKIEDVEVPFASPRLLWRMKKNTHRDKDAGDLFFLRKWFEARGESPPE
jgi:hypothetical protein